MSRRPPRSVRRSRPALTCAIAGLLLGLAACGGDGSGGDGGEAAASRPNVLLLTLDTLRADHLGCYGYRLDTTPAMDRLAEEGVRFADATPSTPKTWPSVATLLTGTGPRTHGVRYQNRAIAEQLPTLPELFAAAGYRTGAVVTNFNLQERYGYGRGVEDYVEAWDAVWDQLHPGEPLPQDPTERLKKLFGSQRMRALFQSTGAQFVTDQGLAWLQTQTPAAPATADASAARGADADPWFLWLHYMDPHGPYDPPREYLGMFAGEYPEQPVPDLKSPHLHTPKGASEPIRDLGFYIRRYDQEIRSLDDQLARLFAWLDEAGLREDTLVILTADHGEALGQHDYYLEHGLQPYQECAHVPLVVRWPGHLPAGATVEEPVGLLDLPPTVLELAGLDVPAVFEGQSLAGLARGDADAEAPAHVFMESGDDRFPDRPLQLSVRQGPWKLVHVRSEEDRAELTGAEFELYDVRADAGEQRSRAEAEARIVQKLEHELLVWGLRHPEPGVLSEEDYLDTLEEHEIQMFMQLGYVDGAAFEAWQARKAARDARDTGDPGAPSGGEDG